MRDYDELFRTLPADELPSGFIPATLTRIAHARLARARRMLVLHSTLFVASFVALIPATQYFLSELSRSDIFQYLSLLFSDGGAVMTYWQDFSLLVLESLPVLGVVVLLSTLLALVASARTVLRDAGVFQHPYALSFNK